MSKYALPLIIITCLILAPIKRVNAYKSFCNGAKESIPLIMDVFPFLVAIFIMVGLMRASGLTQTISSLLFPIMRVFGLPSELTELVVIKPFTGSGSTALLSDILLKYGADSYIGRCACVIMGSSETVFYVSTVYFSQTKVTRLLYAVPVALLACFIGAIVSCQICKIL